MDEQKSPTYEVVHPEKAPRPDTVIQQEGLAAPLPTEGLPPEGETNPDHGPEHRVDITPSPEEAIKGLEKKEE